MNDCEPFGGGPGRNALEQQLKIVEEIADRLGAFYAIGSGEDVNVPIGFERGDE